MKFYNTVSKQKEEFKPLIKGKVSLYVCGPTVYSEPHLGNGLSIVVFDLLYRVLRNAYGKNNVTYVRNITDVEDKINNKAKELGIKIGELTRDITKIFHDNAKKLGCLEPNIEPKVTEHISEIIEMISTLIDSGYAYENKGHVYFEVRKYIKYGEIAGRKIDDLLAGARIEISSLKKDPADFILWKPAGNESDPSAVFDSPFGKGRPGWHIECSAMSTKYLGKNFDIHGGGVDLVFPHHTNEIAQSCCAYPGSIYANLWMHNGFLTVEGEKMSKSLGNFITINELLNSGIDGEVIRFHLLSTHYRKPMDWNEKAVENAKKALDVFYRAISHINTDTEVDMPKEFLDAINDDLNTPVAYAVLYELVSKINKADSDKKSLYSSQLKACANLLGLLTRRPEEWFNGVVEGLSSDEIEKQINLRNQAKKDKNFALADQIRSKLEESKIILEDKSNGTTIWRNA